MAPLKRKIAKAATEEAQPRKSAKVQTKTTSKATKNALTTKKVVVKQPVEESPDDADELETAIQKQYASESSDSDSASDVDGDSGAEDLFKAMADEIVVTPGVQSRLNAAKAAEKSGGRKKSTAIVFLASMPHDLTVPMLYKYFSQFGRVTRALIPDSKNDGKASHAYISFASQEVAKVVVDTMNNYMIDGKLLHCSLVSEADHPKIISKFFKKKPEVEVSTEASESKSIRYRGIFTSTSSAKRFLVKKKKLDQETKENLKALGVDYDFPPFKLVSKLQGTS
ncbi:nucleolar protein [Dispira parvispora]|uniref:Nucleolar protein n=1 Tax=Dispira parvispora TaxID=1520584 RepID=A0A9W8ATN6_9FUNG|nr:nucleolar protein [Dispira parvispora]